MKSPQKRSNPSSDVFGSIYREPMKPTLFLVRLGLEKLIFNHRMALARGAKERASVFVLGFDLA